MTDEHVLAQAGVNVPDPQRPIARAGDGVSVLGHLQATHSRRMAPHRVLALARTGQGRSATTAGVDGENCPRVPVPGRQIPDPDVMVATAADENVAAGRRGPDAHGMADQSALTVTIGVEDVDLGITGIERDDDVLWRQMQAGHGGLVRRNVALLDAAAVPPRSVDLVALLGVRHSRGVRGLSVRGNRPLVVALGSDSSWT